MELRLLFLLVFCVTHLFTPLGPTAALCDFLDVSRDPKVCPRRTTILPRLQASPTSSPCLATPHRTDKELWHPGDTHRPSDESPTLYGHRQVLPLLTIPAPHGVIEATPVLSRRLLSALLVVVLCVILAMLGLFPLFDL